MLSLLAALAQLALQFVDLSLRIAQGEILHNHGLSEDVRRIGPILDKLTQNLFRLGISLLGGRAFHSIGQSREELAFFGGHVYLQPKGGKSAVDV